MTIRITDHMIHTQEGADIIFQYFNRLIFEVLGAAGAVWGFSEACGLRTDATNWFWRPVVLTIGTLYFIRWFVQLLETIAEAKRHVYASTCMKVLSSSKYQDVSSYQDEDVSYQEVPSIEVDTAVRLESAARSA